MSDALNPYQPPSSDPAPQSWPVADGFTFRLTRENLHHGQSHHLIRCRPVGVMLVSLMMIAISLAIFSYCVYLTGPMYALVVMPVLLALSAWAYLAVINVPKKLTQERMDECGLIDGVVVTVQADGDHLTANVGEKTVSWSRDAIKRYRTPQGLMIVPEQYVFLFLPRRGQFDRATFKSIMALFPSS